MTLISKEREKYEAVWDLPDYAAVSPGEKCLPMFLDMAKTTMRGSVLDAGCGSGRGALALKAQGFDVRMCDLTDAGLVSDARAIPFVGSVSLWSNLVPHVGFSDWVYCCDVLEHIPPPFTMLVIARLLAVARRGVFLNIATVPDQFGVWVGEPLHKTVMSFIDWRDAIGSVGHLVEARDCLNSAAFLVRSQ